MSILTYQAQPTNDTCVSACIAMVLGVPVQEVIADFHNRLHHENVTLRDYLYERLLCPQSYLADEYVEFEDGYVYFATVPSLNTKGTFHQILFDCTGTKLTIHDPNNDPDKLRYVLRYKDENLNAPLKENEYPLMSWVIEHGIHKDDILKWRES